MAHPFVRKLRHGAGLTEDDEKVLTDLTESTRFIGPRSDILVEGDEQRFMPLVTEGWACRYRLLENGRRQIITVFLPGDLCEPFGVLPRFADHSIGALTPTVFVPVKLDAVRNAVHASPRIEEALWWDLLVAWEIEREHLVNLGRRSATERLAHLFCELHLRLSMVGIVDGTGYDMPITQADLGDLLGLSVVHVNRSLQELRRTGLMSLRKGRLIIHDLNGLCELALFDERYLHPQGLITPQPRSRPRIAGAQAPSES